MRYNIVEVDKKDEFDDINPVYSYKNLSIKPKLNFPNEDIVFFNGTNFGKSDYITPEENVSNVLFVGNRGNFVIDKKDIKIKNGHVSVDFNKLSNKDQKTLNPNKIIVKPIEKPSIKPQITGLMVRDSLKMAYPNNWREKDDNYTAGLRGKEVYPLGDLIEGLGDCDWSVMNFFDTRNVWRLINDKWEKEGSGNPIKWLSDIFTDKSSDFFKEMVKTQLKSLRSGVKTEEIALKNLLKLCKKKNLIVEHFITYPPGHRKDREEGIDFSVKLKNWKQFNVQVKPLSGLDEQLDGSYVVYTHGMMNYKEKSNLHYILYNMDDKFIMFKNENYVVYDKKNGKVVSKDGTVVIHNNKSLLKNL